MLPLQSRGAGWLPSRPPDVLCLAPHPLFAGIRGVNPHDKKCWLYYPEDDCPFYRTTIFSHYADKNTPGAGVALPTLVLAGGSAPADGEAHEGPYWSLMFEVSESIYKPVEQGPVALGGTAGTWSALVQETIQGALNTQLVGLAFPWRFPSWNRRLGCRPGAAQIPARPSSIHARMCRGIACFLCLCPRPHTAARS